MTWKQIKDVNLKALEAASSNKKIGSTPDWDIRKSRKWAIAAEPTASVASSIK
jgi:hypothetical protein